MYVVREVLAVMDVVLSDGLVPVAVDVLPAAGSCQVYVVVNDGRTLLAAAPAGGEEEKAVEDSRGGAAKVLSVRSPQDNAEPPPSHPDAEETPSENGWVCSETACRLPALTSF